MGTSLGPKYTHIYIYIIATWALWDIASLVAISLYGLSKYSL